MITKTHRITAIYPSIPQEIKVTSFKDSGKYYDTFYLSAENLGSADHWFQIINAVKEFKATAALQSNLTWVIECPTRNDSYPAMLK